MFSCDMQESPIFFYSKYILWILLCSTNYYYSLSLPPYAPPLPSFALMCVFAKVKSKLLKAVFFSRHQRSSPDVEATLNRIKSLNGVLGVIVVNNDGIAIRSTLDNSTTQMYLLHCRHLISLARHTIRDIDPTDDLRFFRVRSKKNELVIAPDQGYTIIALQSCSAKWNYSISLHFGNGHYIKDVIISHDKFWYHCVKKLSQLESTECVLDTYAVLGCSNKQQGSNHIFYIF